MKWNTRKSLAVLALVSGIATAPVALSHLDSNAFYVSYRQSLFAILGANFGPMSSMIKGEIPWDDKAFIGYATDLSMASELDFLRGFPAGSDTGQTRAKPAIWENMADFESKLADLRRESDALAEIARNGNKKEILMQFQKTGGTCKACHDEYKSKDYIN